MKTLKKKDCQVILAAGGCWEFREIGTTTEKTRDRVDALKAVCEAGIQRVVDRNNDFPDIPWAPGCGPCEPATPPPAPEPRPHKYKVGEMVYIDGLSLTKCDMRGKLLPVTMHGTGVGSPFKYGEPWYTVQGGFNYPESSLRPAPRFEVGDWVVTTNNTLVKVTSRKWDGNWGWRYDGKLTRGHHGYMHEANLRPLAEVTA